MAGIYANSSIVDFCMRLPCKLELPLVGQVIHPSYNSTLAELFLLLIDGSLTPVYNDVLSNFASVFPTGSVFAANGTLVVRLPANQLPPIGTSAEGTWTAMLFVDPAVPTAANYDTSQTQFQLGLYGGAILSAAAAASKGYTSRAINLQDSYESPGINPTRVFAPFADPETGLPEVTGLPLATAAVYSFAHGNARTATVNWVGTPELWSVEIDGALGPDAGQWLIVLTQVIGGITQTQYDWFWWGAGVPVDAATQATLAKAAALAAATAAGNAETQASLANTHAVDAKNEATDARIASQAGLALQRGNNKFDPATGILHVYDEAGLVELVKWQCYQNLAMTTLSTSPANILVSVKI